MRAYRDERRRCRRAGGPRLHAEHRRAAPPSRRRDAGAARRRSSRRRDAAKSLIVQVASMHFKERAHVKLHDAQLQHNLKKIKGKFVEKRKASLTELDDFEGTREAARAIRQRALDDLDVWLTIFDENARARGATVLYAQTPAE